MKPALAALAIFLFLFQWNDFIWPLVVLRDASEFTIPVALASSRAWTRPTTRPAHRHGPSPRSRWPSSSSHSSATSVSGLLAGAVKE